MPEFSVNAVIAAILCHYDRHAPVRAEVEWDGYRYIGHCSHCGKKVERISRRDWRQAGRYPAEKVV